MVSEWTNLEVVKLVVSVLTPISVTVIGYWITRHFKEIENNRNQIRMDAQERENRKRVIQNREYQERKELEKLEREERKNEMERRYTPHIEFKIDAQFFGPEDGNYLVNFILIADNRGIVKHTFPKIELRVRGIRKGEGFKLWEKYDYRAEFPHKIFKDNVSPWNFIFVEPGVTQKINYSTVISEEYAYILVHARFHYDKYTPHTVEAIFPTLQSQ